jgi:hypothetical protein
LQVAAVVAKAEMEAHFTVVAVVVLVAIVRAIYLLFQAPITQSQLELVELLTAATAQTLYSQLSLQQAVGAAVRLVLKLALVAVQAAVLLLIPQQAEAQAHQDKETMAVLTMEQTELVQAVVALVQ